MTTFHYFILVLSLMAQPCCLSPIIPDELVIDILSRLPVKPLLRFRCVSKPWNSLTSLDPQFVKLHLHRSPKNPNLILMVDKSYDDVTGELHIRAVLCSKQSLIQNNVSSIVAAEDGRSFRLNDTQWCVGSCNGLVCFRWYGCHVEREDVEIWVWFWNPALRLTSQNSPTLYLNKSSGNSFSTTRYGFGYDSSSDTYKAVVMILGSKNTTVNVHSMGGDNCWKEILSFPTIPILGDIDGEFLSGTLNWLALPESGSDYESDDDDTVDQLVIFSLDLEKVAYKQLSFPSGLDVVSDDEPSLKVLGGCLCLFHYYRGTQFVIWQMKEFGVEKSWTLLFNISDQHLRIDIDLPFKPLCTSENGDVVVVANSEYYEAILCNWKNNTVEVIKTSDNEIWRDAKDYVESFVLPG